MAFGARSRNVTRPSAAISGDLIGGAPLPPPRPAGAGAAAPAGGVAGGCWAVSSDELTSVAARTTGNAETFRNIDDSLKRLAEEFRRNLVNAVAERVRERVVPWPDDADQPDRPVADHELAAEHERVGGADLLVAEVVGSVLGPEAERVGGVGDLGEQRVLVGLAGLLDERLGDPLRVVGHPLLGAAEDLAAAVEAERLPGGLGGAAALGHRAQLVEGGGVDAPDELAGRRVVDLDLGALLLGGRHQAASTVSIFASSRGRSRPSVGRPSSSSTISMPDFTSPNTVCLPSSHGAASTVTMKLRAVGVRPGIGHRERAADDLVRVDLVLERVAGAAGAGALRTAALDHEVLDDAVERQPVIEAVGSQLLEVLDRLRRLVVEQLEDDRAAVGGHRDLGQWNQLLAGSSLRV